MAASDANRPIKNAPYRITYPIRNNSTGVLISAATGLDAEISKDGGTSTDIAGTDGTEIATNTGIYFAELTAAEMSADQLVFKVTSTSANAQTYVEVIKTEPASHSGVAQGATSTSLTLASTASSTNDLYNGQTLEIVRGTGAGQTRTITDYVGSTVTATVDRAWITNPDTTSVYKITPCVGGTFGTDIVQSVNVSQLAGNTTAATLLKALYGEGLVSGSINDAGPTTTDFDGNSGLSSTNDFYNNALLVMTSGTLKGLCRKIDDYVGSSRNLSFSSSEAWPSAPANGDSFVILGRVI